jgi:hypothetical protein
VLLDHVGEIAQARNTDDADRARRHPAERLDEEGMAGGDAAGGGGRTRVCGVPLALARRAGQRLGEAHERVLVRHRAVFSALRADADRHVLAAG